MFHLIAWLGVALCFGISGCARCRTSPSVAVAEHVPSFVGVYMTMVGRAEYFVSIRADQTFAEYWEAWFGRVPDDITPNASGTWEFVCDRLELTWRSVGLYPASLTGTAVVLPSGRIIWPMAYLLDRGANVSPTMTMERAGAAYARRRRAP